MRSVIAKFMGFKIDGKCAYIEDEGSPLEESILLSDMNYDSSWDWLMPVVEKIESIKGNDNKYFVVEIALCFCRIYSKPKAENFHINKGFDTKLTSTYNAVVEFIKWYNKKLG